MVAMHASDVCHNRSSVSLEYAPGELSLVIANMAVVGVVQLYIKHEASPPCILSRTA